MKTTTTNGALPALAAAGLLAALLAPLTGCGKQAGEARATATPGAAAAGSGLAATGGANPASQPVRPLPSRSKRKSGM